MHSDLIGKIEKARHYAQEPERVEVQLLHAVFRGSNNEHQITLEGGQWVCDCTAFRTHSTCAHVMSLQKILAPMLDTAAREDVRLGLQSDTVSMIEKSRHYAHEPERLQITAWRAVFRGSNNDHTLTLADDVWACDCTTFRLHGTCAHVMAAQKILAPMLSEAALRTVGGITPAMIASTLS